MTSPTTKQPIQKSSATDKLLEASDRSFNNGYCWALQSDDYIGIVMIEMYYETLRFQSSMDDDEYYYDVNLNRENDARMMKLFVPKDLLCKIGDDSCIYAIGFMRGVVAGVEQRRLFPVLRWPSDIAAIDAAALGKTAAEMPRCEGRGSEPGVLQ